MPLATCSSCGRPTNSTCSDYWTAKEHKPTECYAAFDVKARRWVRGCALDRLPRDSFEYGFAHGLIQRGSRVKSTGGS